MTADAVDAARTATPCQRFSVSYSFPVVVPGRIRPRNPALRDALCRLEPAKRHRVVFFVDDGLSAGHAPLIEAIAKYAQRHTDVIELACAPVAVPGGEKIKSDLHFVESVQQRLFDLHIDRHSFVVAVGGGGGAGRHRPGGLHHAPRRAPHPHPHHVLRRTIPASA